MVVQQINQQHRSLLLHPAAHHFSGAGKTTRSYALTVFRLLTTFLFKGNEKIFPKYSQYGTWYRYTGPFHLWDTECPISIPWTQGRMSLPRDLSQPFCSSQPRRAIHVFYVVLFSSYHRDDGVSGLSNLYILLWFFEEEWRDIIIAFIEAGKLKRKSAALPLVRQLWHNWKTG